MNFATFSTLKKNKNKLIELAEILVEKEVIFEGDLKTIFGPRPFETEPEVEKKVDSAPKEDKSDKEITEENPK